MNDIVDGGQDKQIDAIKIEDSSDEATIYITQIKSEDNFSSNSIIQIRNGLKWIFEKRIADIDQLSNMKFKDRIKDYRKVQSDLGPSNIYIKVAYIINGGASKFSDECQQEIDTIIQTYDNDTFVDFTFEALGADKLVDILNSQEKKTKRLIVS